MTHPNDAIINYTALAAQHSDLRQAFAHSGRIRIHSFLQDEIAAKVMADLAVLDWRLVMNDAQGRHVDISPSEQKRMGGKALRALKTKAQKRALSQFSYVYENYPVYDRIVQNMPVPETLKSVYAALSSDEFIKFICDVTQKPIDYCDIQATRYRSGHLLTEHDDDVPGKHRQCAYVLSMCPKWQRKWGGNLEFVGADGTAVESFVPAFNALSVFAVPAAHRVSKVRASVLPSRYSLTGWMRRKV